MSNIFNDLTFVSTEWLANQLGQPGLVVVDGSWHLPPTGRNGAKEHAEGHIAGAVFFDLDLHSDPSIPLPHMLPPEAQFAAAASALGISNDTTIVVYDQTGLFSAPRVAWMFRLYGAADVRILEGGLPRWKAEGRAVTDVPSTPAPATFIARRAGNGVADVSAVASAIAARTAQVVDARPAARFRGEAPEPRPGVRAGHIPGSLNLPFDAIAANGALKSADEIKAALANAGIASDQPVITSCGSGVSACIIGLALAKAGTPVSAVYDGSWAEWGSREELPLGVGAPKA